MLSGTPSDLPFSLCNGLKRQNWSANCEVTSVSGTPSWNGEKYRNDIARLSRFWYVDHSCAKVHPNRFSRFYLITRQTHIHTQLCFYIMIRMMMITYIKWLREYFSNSEIILRINNIFCLAEKNSINLRLPKRTNAPISSKIMDLWGCRKRTKVGPHN